MKQLTIFPALVLLACSVIGPPAFSAKNDYQVGQVWSYKTRPQEEQSTVTIVLIENNGRLGPIVHISVSGLKLKNPDAPDQPYDVIAHMPFSQKAIDKSVIKLIKENAELPDFKEGYEAWRLAFDNNQATIYNVPIAEAIDKAEKNLTKKK